MLSVTIKTFLRENDYRKKIMNLAIDHRNFGISESVYHRIFGN